MSISIDNMASYLDNTTKTAASSGTNLQKTLGTDLSSASDDELMDVCKQFEAYFIEQVLKEVQKTIPNQDGNSAASQLTNFHKETLVQNLAGQIGDESGNSLAQMMYEQMKRNYDL